MSRQSSVASLLVVGSLIPVALLLGYLVAVPLDRASLLVIGALIALLAFPFMVKWHHWLLVASITATVNAFFLPGGLPLWMVLAWVSLGFTLVNSGLVPEQKLNPFTKAGWPLLVLAVVVLMTIKFTGGIGMQAGGGDRWGGKSYVGVLSAVAAFFVISSIRVSERQAERLCALHFLGGLTGVVSNLLIALGPSAYFLFRFFSVDAGNAVGDQGEMTRLVGLSYSAMSVIYFMLMRYRLAGVFNLHKPWRLVVFAIVFAAGLLGGFRSSVIILLMMLAIQFFLEGLHRTRAVAVLVIALMLGGAILVGLSDRLPLAVQRSISFLPIQIDPAAKKDAAASLEWRLEMWKVVIHDVPKYLLLGKGYVFSGSDFQLTSLAVSRGYYAAFEDTLISGNYHNGFLTLIIPFGIWGLAAFIWFAVVGFRILYVNYARGNPELRNINTFLLTIYSTRMIFYWFLYGQFNLDLIGFVSYVALSICINRNYPARKPEAGPVSVGPTRPLQVGQPASA